MDKAGAFWYMACQLFTRFFLSGSPLGPGRPKIGSLIQPSSQGHDAVIGRATCLQDANFQGYTELVRVQNDSDDCTYIQAARFRLFSGRIF